LSTQGIELLSTPNRRRLLFALLYFSEGAPIGFLWWALPTQLRVAGVPLPEITALTATLALPWALKFLWAPLVDTLQSPRWSIRAWIVASQLLMGVTLLPLLVLDLQSDLPVILPLLILHAVTAATQDVSVDALCIATTGTAERGTLNGWMQAGMLTGRAFFGGGTLLLADLLGTDGLVLMLVSVIWSVTAIVTIAVRPHRGLTSETGLQRLKGFVVSARGAVRSRGLWFGLAIAAVGGAGFEAVGSIAGPYLIDRGFSTTEVGFFFAFPSVAGMVLGALAGGVVSDRMGRARSVAVFLSLLALSIFALAVTDLFGTGTAQSQLVIALSFVYLCIGFYTSSSYALFMDITDRRLGATQFSAYMGTTNACESWSTFAIGRLVPLMGYPLAIAVMAMVSLTVLPLLAAGKWWHAKPESDGEEERMQTGMTS